MVEKLSQRWKFAPLIIFQIILMGLYFGFAKYGGAQDVNNRGYEDTHVMIFIGFAFLMTFLKKYGYSALGINWFLAALCIQWALICQGFFHMKDNSILITKKSLLEADIMSATVLITMGALLGLVSATQLLFIGIIEIAVGCTNLWLLESVYQANDIGGSIAIHTYGAYFGLGASTVMRFTEKKEEETTDNTKLDGPSYTSDITATLGSLFLWIYWPSFNAGLASSDAEYQRAVVNTYISLAACTVTSFILSSMVSHKPGKFDMVHIQNSTLAGGVGVGAVANMFISPGGAMAIGIGAGIISVLGYRYLTPRIHQLGVVDTCGVHNLHGTPGVYSGLLSILFTYLATSEVYGDEMGNIFEPVLKGGRTFESQAFYQLLALATTLVLGYGSGVVAGFLANTKLFTSLTERQRYDDELNWELP